MADTLTQGKKYLFYVAADGAPTSPSATTNYSKVGLLISDTLSTTNDTVEARHKDSGGYRYQIPTTKGSTITLEGYFPADGNAGTSIIYDASQSTTASTQIVGFLSTTGVTGEDQFRGTGYVLSFERSNGVDEVATWTAEISVIGAVTTEAVS